MLTFILILVIIALLWLLAIELRFHSLKNLVGVSLDTAENAIHTAETLFTKVEAKLPKRGK
jgi:hypothetical protein